MPHVGIYSLNRELIWLFFTTAVPQTYSGPAMMHAETLIAKAREGDRLAQGQLMQVWYKRIYNFGFKFFIELKFFNPFL